VTVAMVVSENSPSDYAFRDLQLEMSLKPFFESSADFRREICAELFTQWMPLARHAERISILLWVGDGSEILEFSGNLSQPLEWARYHGAANPHFWEVPDQSPSPEPDHAALGIAAGSRDPEGKGLHRRSYLYRENPARFTYRWLADLVADLKSVGAAMTGKPVHVGQAFDIGPEFALSRFKYEWHREILSDGPVFREQFVSCEAVLEADTRQYAAFPEGIPEGLSIGTFLGKQVRALFEALGQEFLWLSNGFGFALEPWAMVGKVFDGSSFHAELLEPTSARIFGFWEDLCEGWGPDARIRCRGTNLAMGIDLASDASPFRRIYRTFGTLELPVNSPWAALDGDFGLTLGGWMSRIAGFPDKDFRYRFYLHDPWWMNSPWFDRYGRTPQDVYLPLSVSRLRSDGTSESPRDLAMFTVDNSLGAMPVAGANEVAAHVLRAREDAPDELGPLVWLYPLDEYDRWVMDGGRAQRPLHADAWIGTVLNAGVPLNSVADAEILRRAVREHASLIAGRVWFAPVPEPGTGFENLVRWLVERGGRVLLYGPLFEGSFLWSLLDLEAAEPLSGDFSAGPGFDGEATVIRHLEFLSAGGWSERSRCERGDGWLDSVEVSRGGERRVALRVVRSGEGIVAWTRASLATAEFDPDDPKPIRGPILRPLGAPFEESSSHVPRALESMGWRLAKERVKAGARGPFLVVHRHRNALILAGYHRNEHDVQRIRLPLGAPLLTGRHNRIEDGCTVMRGERVWRHECRVLIERMEAGIVECRELPPVMHGIRRRLLVTGLRDADLVVLPETWTEESLRLLRDPKFPYFHDEALRSPVQSLEGHRAIRLRGLTGELLLEW